MSLLTEVFVIALVSVVLAWAPASLHLTRGLHLSRKLKIALMSFTVSPILLITVGLQSIFEFGHSRGWYLIEAAPGGFLACVLAFAFATADLKVSRTLAVGVMLGSMLDIVVWLYLGSLH
jgi:hypothetical protein